MDDDAPNTEIAAVNEPLDVSNAAALLTRATASQAEGRERAADGKFVSRQAESTPSATDTDTAIEQPDNKVVDLKTGKPAESADPAEAEAEDDEYFEWPSEKDGEAPRRVKVDEVIAAYDELPKIRAELESTKKSAPPPADYLTALQDTVQQRSRYLDGLNLIAQITRPADPPLDMLNPQHQSYNPDAYYAQKQQADQARAMLANIADQQKAHEEQQAKENEVLIRAHMAREAEALEKAWPEWKQEAIRKSVVDGLASVYGFRPDEIKGIADHRQLMVIRDALELRALKAKQAEAVKVVRQKPKLVKGAARTTTNPKAAKAGAAMQQLAETNSVDAAAKALKALGF